MAEVLSRTELVPEDPPIKPGKKIPVYRYKIANFRLQKMLQSTARLQIWLLECDSNNASGEVTARDARTVNLGMEQMLKEWRWARQFKDSPTGDHERIYSLLVPRDDELQRMKNGKLQMLSLELSNLTHVVLSSQAAKQQAWVGEGSEPDIDSALGAVLTVTREMVGDGSSNGDDPPTFNTGSAAPDYSLVGELHPPPGEMGVQIQEASSGAVGVALADAPDVSATPEA